MAEIIGIRRDLPAGVVFFRQTGAVVEYSFDNVLWRLGWIMQQTPSNAVSPELYELIADMDISEFTQSITQQLTTTITVNNWLQYAADPKTKLDGNLCAASKVLAAAAAHMINVTREAAGDDATRYQAAGATVGAGGIALLLLITPPGWIAGGVAALLAGIGAVLGLGGSIGDFVAYADNTPDIDSDTLAEMACHIYRAAKTSGANAATLRNALSVSHDDIDAIPAAIASAYEALWDTAPQLYSVYLAYLTESENSECVCGQCRPAYPSLWDAGATGYPSVVPMALIINPTRVYQTNEYKLQAAYTLPAEYQGRQIDSVTTRWLVTGYGAEQSGWTLRVSITGYLNQISTVSYARAQLPAVGYQEIVTDFTGATLQNGVDGLTVIYRTNYSSYLAPAADATSKVMLIGCTYCMRGI